MKRIFTAVFLLGVLVASAGHANTITVNAANLSSGSPCAPGFCSFAYTNPVWFFYNDETDVLDNGLGSFVTGPGTPLSGSGSAQISVSGTQRRNLATYQFKGTPLSALTTLSYTTYNPSAGNGGSASRSAYLQFNVDFAANDTWQRRLIFLPSDNGSVVQDSWKTWDCLNGGNALWRYSGATWPAPISVAGSIPQTWSAILAAYPSVRFRLTDSWLGMRVGEPYPDGYTENIDNFTLGTASGTTTFDFEPGPAFNVVAPVAPLVCITPANPCVSVPMNIARTDAIGVRGFTVTLQLSSNLALCNGLTSDVSEGTYLNSVGGTNFQVVDNGGGSYTVDCAILGPTAGATAASGTLFTLNLKNVGGDGTGTVTVTNVGLRDPVNAAIPGDPGAPASVNIDNTAPTAVSGLVATQQLTGNPAGPTTNINLSWAPVEAGATVRLYRRGFGNYPEYDDAPNAGSVPGAPGAYPPAGWALVATLPSATTTFTDYVETVNVSFEAPTYSLGNINGQDGWSKTGPFDVNVAGSYGWPTFGAQSLRISNAVTSGSFGDQTFAKPLVNAAGETGATAGAFSVGVRKSQFEVQFDVASVLPTYQPGMAMSMSPDRGDGSRMSYLGFFDAVGGIDVVFYDVQGTTNPANFVGTTVATLSRTAAHRIRLAMQFVDGPSNDVVQVYIDGALVHTGTSWENYYRYDSEAIAEQSPRIVKTVIFRTGGAAVPANAGNGFLFDNLTLSSGTRDFWYYTAYVTDACGNHSAAAPVTGGTLNYHLGDVTDGLAAGTGNNLVNSADISLLGMNYGITITSPHAVNYLDVGPTTNYYVNTRPTTDNKINFEDLMMFAINYGTVSAPQDVPALVAAGANEVGLGEIPSVAVGETFTVPVRMSGTGDVLGASFVFAYDANAVEFVSAQAGGLLRSQGREHLVLSPGAGTVDFALLGEGSGVTGEGDLVEVTFRRTGAGEPAIALKGVTARDAANRPVSFTGVTPTAPAATQMSMPWPNPFRGNTSLRLALAHEGKAKVAIYDLVGRKVRMLVDGVKPAGEWTLVWDGRDDGGRPAPAGLYLVRFTGDGAEQVRRVILTQ